ncbi:MAG: sigma factor-like helix-turn-helix DNA-binding protein [bacterium]|nr:sigma factor-like helix-turn-helix DNA-binding protein [bacterium]
MNNISPIKFDQLVGEVVETLPKRTKIVLMRRFGLKNGKHETLESIGQDYGITRERVRQIENDALKQLSRNEVRAKLEPAFQYLQDHFKDHGHVQAEHRVLEHLSGAAHPHPTRQAIVFVLTLGEPFERESESDAYHAHWATDKDAKGRMAEMIKHVIAKLEDASKLLTKEELFEAAMGQANVPPHVAAAYIDVSKEVMPNVFGEWGLAEWPEVSPRGVRDKAYLVLRREAKPLHFSDITDHINEAGFSNRKAYVQTVHNELIKDNRFVLVGRGLYALTDWGYSPGTVRDILLEIIKSRGPLTRDEILEETLKRRMVRPNTIILNLQNGTMFTRLQDGRYALAGAAS